MKKYLTFAVILFLLVACQQEKNIYVDLSTTCTHPDGSQKAPYSKLESALKYVHSEREKGRNHPFRILLAKGEYYFEQGFYLDSLMSNLNIEAIPGERIIFSGGKSIPVSLVQEDLINNRQVKVVDLKKIGIENYGEIKNVGFSRPFKNSWAELFVNGKPMNLSRWPNEGMIPMGKIIDQGSIPRNNDFSNRGAIMEYDSARISSWTFTNDMWISGYFKVGYADDALRLKEIDTQNKTLLTDGPTLYGFGSGQPWNKWFAFNIKEETDLPGEYYLDRKTGQLFFISNEDVINSLNISMLEEPFFEIHKAKNLNIKNIIFEYSRAAIISLCETENVNIQNCVFRNSGDLGIIVGMGIKAFKDYKHEGIGEPTFNTIGSLLQHLYSEQTFYRKGGYNNKIDHCKFYNLGAGGISLGGGNRKTLKAGNNKVSNCLFHSNNRIAKSYRPAIHITGVGNQISNCEIYDTPSMAILMNGNNHLIENNYIHDVCLEIEDQGAFYYGRNPSECGTILRNNLFANIPGIYSTCAVYHDDGSCGLTVTDNIFYQTGRYGVIMGGGSDNVYKNNIFINGNTAIHIDKRLQNWAKSLLDKNGLFYKRLNEIKFNEEPYKSAYPYMKDYWPNDSLPKRNIFENNHFIGYKVKADNPNLIQWNNNIIETDSIKLDFYTKEVLLEILSKKGLDASCNYKNIGIKSYK